MTARKQHHTTNASAALRTRSPRIAAAWRLRWLPVFCAALLLAASGCGGDVKEEASRTSPGDSLRLSGGFDIGSGTLVDSLQADMNGDGIPEAVLFSMSDSLAGDPLLRSSFDRVDIYDSSSQPPTRLFFDVIEDGRRAETGDVTGDGVADLIVELDAGGNNPLTSRGMHLYGLNAEGAVTLLFYTSEGAPELRDLDGDGVSEVLVSDQFWGMMAHSEVIVYTREVYAFDGNTYTFANAQFGRYFDSNIHERMKKYEKEKRAPHLGDEARLRLYRSAAEVLAWSYARGGVSRVSRLWRSEEPYLRGELYQEQFDDLSSFINEVSAMEETQKNMRVS